MKYDVCWENVPKEDGSTQMMLFANAWDENGIAVIDEQVKRMGDLCNDIQGFIDEHDSKLTVEIKNDGDYLGIIVDIFDDVECIDTATFWFEDYADNEDDEVLNS